MDLLQEKLTAEFPLTDENLRVFDSFFPSVKLLNSITCVAKPDTKDMGDDEYWQNQQALMVATMNASKAQTGRF